MTTLIILIVLVANWRIIWLITPRRVNGGRVKGLKTNSYD